MSNIVFIADYFADQIPGGGELNNEVLISILISRGISVTKINSRNCTLDFLKQHENSFFILANFVELNHECLNFLQNVCDYIIYEHDHKYVKCRNPALYKDYLIPKQEIINEVLYQNARAVLCQSNFHKNIITKNLSDVNVINLSGNLWSDLMLFELESHIGKTKENKCSIMNSDNWHKNTQGSIEYCKNRNYGFELIAPAEWSTFIDKLSNNSKLVFLPKTPETLSRIVVESRMMGMSVIINDRVGASYEPWFKLKGYDLISEMLKRKTEIPNIVEGLIV